MIYIVAGCYAECVDYARKAGLPATDYCYVDVATVLLEAKTKWDVRTIGTWRNRQDVVQVREAMKLVPD